MGRFKDFIKEKYYDGMNFTYRNKDRYIEVFKNPSNRELESIKKDDDLGSVRIGILKNDVYCWDSIIHHSAMEKQMKKVFDYRLTWDNDMSHLLIGVSDENNKLPIKNTKILSKLKAIFPKVEMISITGNKIYTMPLKENFYKGIELNHPTYQGYLEVFKNPSKREIDSIYKESYDNGVRIGIDNKDNIYVWIEDVLHDLMQKQLKTKFKIRLEYTNNRSDLFLSSGETKKNFDKNISNVLLRKLKMLFPNIQNIKESTGNFENVYSYK